MRRNSILAFALSAAVTLGLVSIATAKFDTFRVGNLILKVDGGVSPTTLPKKRQAPIAVNIRSRILTANGDHPPAFRELIADFDRNGRINPRGLPACRGGQLEARTTAAAKRVCRRSIVGSGGGRIQIAFPEQAPIPVKAPIVVFNGGTKGGKTTLYIHTYITVPVPSAVVTRVTIKRVRKGRYGLATVSRIPVIAGGSGSVIEFNIRLKRTFAHRGKRRSYFTARCADGKFKVRIIKALFRNEAGGARTIATVNDETILRPCTPKG